MWKTFYAFITLNLVLIVFSLIRFPAAGWLHAAPVLVMLVIYAVTVWGACRLSVPPPLNWGLILGAAAGLVLGGEVVLEYILLPADNSLYGLAEYGLFSLLLIICGTLTFRESRSLKAATLAGLWAGMLGSLIWYAVLLLVFHLLFGSSQQMQVFLAEGNLEDFKRSGMADFTTFVVQDFCGAGFFHLLLGAVLGALSGMVGGVIGKIAARFL